MQGGLSVKPKTGHAVRKAVKAKNNKSRKETLKMKDTKNGVCFKQFAAVLALFSALATFSVQFSAGSASSSPS